MEAIVGSQRRQAQLGVKAPTEMTDLAKSYRDRWNQLKVMAILHHSRIQESITEFDTSNIMDTSKLYSLAAIKDTIKPVNQDIWK